MEVMYITRKYPPSVGGMQQNSFELVTELRKLIAVNLIALGKGQLHLWWFIPWAFFRGLTGAPDLIHVGDGLLAPLGWLLARIRNKPFTVTINGLDITYPHRLYRNMVIPFVTRADAVFCNSENTRDLCLARGCKEQTTVVVPCGISAAQRYSMTRETARSRLLRRFSLDANTLLLLSVGRLVKRKGVLWFMQEVLPALPGTTLIIVGEGPDSKALEHASAGNDQVRMLGLVDAAMLQELYCAGDAFVMPNIRVEGDVEGFGIVLLEAGRAGLFPFAARIDGIPEAVCDGRNGRLLESGNAQQWIAELSRFAENRGELETMGAAAREYVMHNCSATTRAQEHYAFWKSLCGKG